MDEQLLSSDELRELTQGNLETDLSKEEIDALGEIGNISIGTSATTLYSLLNNKVIITTPNVRVTNIEKIREAYPIPFITVEVEYTEGLSGTNLMIIKEEDAKIIADLMMGGDGSNTVPELDDIRMSAVGEAMNQMMGSAATSLSTMLKREINISPPKLTKVDLADETLGTHFKEDEEIVFICFKMVVGDLLESEIMQIMSIPFAKTLVDYLYDISGTASTGAVEEKDMATPVEDDARFERADKKGQGVLQEGTKIIEKEGKRPQTLVGPKQSPAVEKSKVSVKPVQFQSFEEEQPSVESSSIDLILDVPLEVTVELGRTTKTVNEILDFGPGSIVELDKAAGEPVDILVNGKLIAKGEVVVIDENFGVRLTEIVNSVERVKSLQ